MKLRGFYFITDKTLSRGGNISDVSNAVAAGVGVVQYRDKGATAKEMCDESQKLRFLCKDILFIVNDRIDVALATGAGGVHLGQDDMPYSQARRILGKQKIIGITVHNIKEAEEAYRLGADYLGVSPIFKTATKSDAGQPAGVNLVKEIRKVVPIPLVAIGGITLQNTPLVIAAGAEAVCAISDVVTKESVKTEIEKFQRLFIFSDKK
jgi:thiamine-phosphate pyrophosphorylase